MDPETPPSLVLLIIEIVSIAIVVIVRRFLAAASGRKAHDVTRVGEVWRERHVVGVIGFGPAVRNGAVGLAVLFVAVKVALGLPRGDFESLGRRVARCVARRGAHGHTHRLDLGRAGE